MRAMSPALLMLSGMLCSTAVVAARHGVRIAVAASVPVRTLLATSARIAPQRDAALGARFAASLPLGDPERYLTPEQLRMAQGRSDEPIESVEIHARQGLCESAQPMSIPFGMAGLNWGAHNPAQAWRLLLPVLDAPRTAAADGAGRSCGVLSTTS
ncbi:MAG TPA: hypothetical protein VMD03_10190 [Steroidobacteraceae bacterium]|nr:hypothetical protein [Steroidobacteraceae bacterium]